MPDFKVGQLVHIIRTGCNEPLNMNEKDYEKAYKIIFADAISYRLDIPGYHAWYWEKIQLQTDYCDNCDICNTCDKINCKRKKSWG